LVQNLTSCSNIIETSLSRALLSQSKQLLLSHSNTSSPAADQPNNTTPLPVNNDENAPTSTKSESQTSGRVHANLPADLPRMLQALQASQPGLSMSQAMVILRNALNGGGNAQSDGSLLPSIDLLSASAASTPNGDISVGNLQEQQEAALRAIMQPAKQSLNARNKGLLEVLAAPDLSPATSDILNRFTMGFKGGNKPEPGSGTSTRPSKIRPSKKAGESGTTKNKRTSSLKRKAAETIEISDTEGASANKPLPDPVKPSTSSRPVTKASTSASHLERRLKTWEPGCLKCGRTESIGWRIRKKRSMPLDGQKGEGAQEDDDDNVKKLCEGESG